MTSISNLDEIRSKQVLFNYLRAPTENGLTLTELIVATENNPSLKPSLEKNVKKIFLDSKDPFFKGIIIKYPGEKLYYPIVVGGGLTSNYASAEIIGKKQPISVTIVGEEKTSEGQARYKAATGFKIT